MGLDMDAMRQGYEDQQRSGGDYLSFEKGETLLYMHPPCRDNDKHQPTKGKNFVPVTVHYGVGKANKMIVSLDPDANPIIEHPVVKAGLKKKKVRLTGKCPVGKALDGGKVFTDEEADESRPQTKYLWGVTPMGFRRKSSGKWLEHDKQGTPCVAMVGKQIFDGIMEQYFDHGDISDPTAAIFVRVIKSGKGRLTKYQVKIDSDTSKAPKKLLKKLRAKIAKAMAEGGDCDLFRVVTNMIKSPDEVTAILKGVEVDEDAEDHDDEIDDDEDDEDEVEDVDDDEDDDEPSDDDEESDDDDEESDDDEDDEESDDEDDDEESDDEDDEDESDDEEDDEPVDEEDDDEDDEPDDEDDEDDDEDDEPPKPSKGKKAAKKADDDDDDDDLGLDDLDEALAELEDDEPEKGKKSKKGKADKKDKADKAKSTKAGKKKASKAKKSKRDDEPKKDKKGKADKAKSTKAGKKKAAKPSGEKKGKKGKADKAKSTKAGKKGKK